MRCTLEVDKGGEAQSGDETCLRIDARLQEAARRLGWSSLSSVAAAAAAAPAAAAPLAGSSRTAHRNG